jgi:hypothetical protein
MDINNQALSYKGTQLGMILAEYFSSNVKSPRLPNAFIKRVSSTKRNSGRWEMKPMLLPILLEALSKF